MQRTRLECYGEPELVGEGEQLARVVVLRRHKPSRFRLADVAPAREHGEGGHDGRALRRGIGDRKSVALYINSSLGHQSSPVRSLLLCRDLVDDHGERVEDFLLTPRFVEVEREL